MPIILVQTANGSQCAKLFALFLEHPIHVGDNYTVTLSSVGVTHYAVIDVII